MPAVASSALSFDRRIVSSPGLNLRFRLRAAIATDHAVVDERFSRFALHTWRGYRRFLEVTAAALLPLEDALLASDVAALIPDWDERTRGAALRSDLAKLDGVVQPLPQLSPFNHDAAFGVLYALEGSRLGAIVLKKRVTIGLGGRQAPPTAYLGHGEGLQLWPRFLRLLERHAGRMHSEAEVTGGARQTFALFARAAGDA
jgi:heme oxygenase